MNLFISKDRIIPWLNQLLQKRILVAPVQNEELISFQPITRAEEGRLDFGNTALSAKDWFLPPTEILFSMQSNGEKPRLTPAGIEKDAVIFGVRPCDAKGIALIDIPLLKEPGDILYQQRRARTTIIGLACRQARPECFCTSMGTAPDDKSNVDILLTETANGYIIQVVTEKGKALLPEGATESKEALPPPPELQAVPAKEASRSVRELFDNAYWERLADRCLHCNVCAYVCPTCYCFDVRDYSNKEGLERVRSWDSCQSPGFSRTAGGYDPRGATKGARLRQRFAHKLLYFPEQFQQGTSCVGCGRCVKSCPVNIDIREVMRDLQQLEAKK